MSERRGPHGPGAVAPNSRARNLGATLRRLLQLLKPERALISLAVILTILSVALNVWAPKVLGRATDLIYQGVLGEMLSSFGLPDGLSGTQLVAAIEAAGQGEFAEMVAAADVVVGEGLDTHALAITLLQVAGLYGVAVLLMWIQGFILVGVIQRTGKRMRAEVESKINRVPLSFIDTGSRGDLISRVTNDVDNIMQTLQQVFSQAMSSVMTVLGTIIMMLTVSWQLSLVAVFTLPVAVVIMGVVMRRSQPHFAKQWKATGDLSGIVEEAFTGHEVVSAFNAEESFNQAFQKENDELYEGSHRAQFISGTIMPTMRIVTNLNFVIIAVLGGIRITSGSMSLGDVQAFIQYSQSFGQPIGQLASMSTMVQSGAASAERLFEIMDEDEEVADVPAVLPERAQGRVTFENIKFSYTEDTELITDLNLTVEAGQTVAIVGPTGAGKTTLVNLLLRFYDPQSGRITLDGKDTREMHRDDLRGQIGMVLQDTWLFEGTIEENIAFGSNYATHESVLAAAKAANVDHMVEALPNGYDTVIDDSGAGISAGEKQLITIARAFLADRQILVLDEATSSVDTRTEVLVQKAMVGLRQGRTSFVIAHRLSTIRDADVILVMENGDIVEQGSHEELLAARGSYYELYQSQFSGGEEAEIDSASVEA